MYCNHTYIFYVLLVIILFVSINLLLLQYYLNQILPSEKHKLPFHNQHSSMNLVTPANKVTPQLIFSGRLRPRMYHFLQQKSKGQIAEPPIPSQMLEKYALNNRYFKKLVNYTIFRYFILTFLFIATSVVFLFINCRMFNKFTLNFYLLSVRDPSLV